MVAWEESEAGDSEIYVRRWLQNSPTGLNVRLQAEVQPIGTSFTGVPNGESGLVASGSDASVTIDGLSKGSKHWRARIVDSLGQRSQWVSFGGNADGTTDFAVQEFTVTAAAATEDDTCGLMGIEAVLLLGLAFFRRRRRAL